MAKTVRRPAPPSLTVKSAATLSGLSSFTLRAWERRYGAVEPGRSKTGRRGYSLEDVERLRLLRRLVQQGHAISSIARLPEKTLLGILQESHSLRINASSTEIRGYIRMILEALDRYDLRTAAEQLGLARKSLGARVFALGVISPLLGRIGNCVREGSLNIAQEHALSAVIRAQLALIYEPFASERPDAPKLVLATVDGDMHEFGILLSAVLASIHGIPIHYLGPSLPAAPLAEASRALSADIVLVGATVGSDWKKLTQYFKELDALLPLPTRLWVGGVEATFAVKQVSPTRSAIAVRDLEDLDRRLAAL